MRSSLPTVIFVAFAILVVLFALDAFFFETGPDGPFVQFTGLVVAMCAGLFGAAFSMLIQIQKRVSQGTLEDLEGGADWQALFIRGAFGVGAAMIVYFFFRSGLLQGSLWPVLTELALDPLKNSNVFKVPNQDVCLLMIWCFIAGFSETFVPNILVRTESRTNG